MFANYGEDLAPYQWMFDRARMRDGAIASLRQAKADGVDALIDLTTPDLTRDVRFIEEVSRASGVHVVVATGIWRDATRSFAARRRRCQRRRLRAGDRVGIGDTSIKAGAIKVANDEDGISPALERVLRAAAGASRRTGCPISTHHWAQGEQGREQLRVFLEEGASPDRICIGHSANTTDVDYLESLLRQRVWLSMDRYPGRPPRPRWQERNAAVKTSIDRGWAHRIMLGHDAPATRPIPAGAAEAPSDDYNLDGLLFLTRVGLPALFADGMPQATVDLMTRDVLRRFLSIAD